MDPENDNELNNNNEMNQEPQANQQNMQNPVENSPEFGEQIPQDQNEAVGREGASQQSEQQNSPSQNAPTVDNDQNALEDDAKKMGEDEMKDKFKL